MFDVFEAEGKEGARCCIAPGGELRHDNDTRQYFE
jgi:hypothetical protein